MLRSGVCPQPSTPGSHFNHPLFTLLHLHPTCCVGERDSCDVRNAFSLDGPQSRQLRATDRFMSVFVARLPAPGRVAAFEGSRRHLLCPAWTWACGTSRQHE